MLLVEDIHNFVNILGAQAVLVAVLEEVLAGVNHEDAGASVGILLVNDQNAGGDAGAVEEIGGQADDSLDHALPDELSTDIRLSVAAKQHTMRQDDGAFTFTVERCNEVQQKSVIAIFGGWNTVLEATELVVSRIETIRPSFVGEGRIGDSEVEGL